MTEVKALRTKHRLTCAQFGRLVYQTERAVRAWEYGERNIPQGLWELALIKLEGIEPNKPDFLLNDEEFTL